MLGLLALPAAWIIFREIKKLKGVNKALFKARMEAGLNWKEE